MFALDLPDVPPQSAPVVMAQASQGQQGNQAVERTMGVCHLVPNTDPLRQPSAENVVEPAGEAVAYFRLYEHRDVKGPAKITLLQGSKHGVLNNEGNGAYAYIPEPGYLGKDRVVALVEIGGFKVKQTYYFQAIPGAAIGNTTYDEYCGKNGYRWKIPLAS